MRKLFYVIAVVFLCAGFAHAGLNDRSSNIDLKRHSAQYGQPTEGHVWIYTKDRGGDRGLFMKDSDNTEIGIFRKHDTVPLSLSAFSVNGQSVMSQLPPGIGIVSLATNNVLDFTHLNTSPGVELIDSLFTMVWDYTDPAGEGGRDSVSPAEITFRVPDNYASGGGFKGWMSNSGEWGATPPEVDYEVIVNALTGTTPEEALVTAAVSNQAPIRLAATGTTPEEVNFTIATDFDNLTPGSWVTFRLWRSDDVLADLGDEDLVSLSDMLARGFIFYYNEQS
ncbi:hypothetical protein LCGC14_1898710 [marine sediment metagenome]|uniref:Uncharacterized protein n=1 Tax=marine sediment metagenome TaxID=412755 RepID=A0A0F9GKM0_9ZZZZ